MTREAFISYASPDRAVAMALVADLEAKGISCWIAPRDVPGGSKYAEVILKALAETRMFLLLFSEHSNVSEHVLREVERALHLSKPMVPVRLTNATPSGSMDYYLATLHWIDAFGGARNVAFDTVANAAAGILNKTLIVPGSPAASDGGGVTGNLDAPEGAGGRSGKETGRSGKLVKVAMTAGLVALVLAVAVTGLFKNENLESSPEAAPADIVADAPGEIPGTKSADEADDAAAQALRFSSAVQSAVADVEGAWRTGDRETALLAWAPVLEAEAGKVTPGMLGSRGASLMQEMLAAAADDAEEGTAVDFETLDAWRPLVEFSEILKEASASERDRFSNGWRVRNALKLWGGGERESAARALASIESDDPALLLQAREASTPTGKLLRGVLDEVVDAAAAGRLGTLEGLAQEWSAVLRMAADAGNARAHGVLATLAWEAGDYSSAALLVSKFSAARAANEATDPILAGLLAKVISAANAGNQKAMTRDWEPAFQLAHAYALPGGLEVLAEVIHRRDPGEAAPLFRQLFKPMEADTTVRRRVAFCLKMLTRYDIGEESVFYRARLQEAFESTLATLDQQRTGGRLIEEIPEITHAAAAGIPAAQYIMGDLLSEGKGMEKNPELAFDYYSKAANSGFIKARYAVGECLRDGRGTPKNVAEAMRIWKGFSDEEAAEVPQVLFNLAQLTPPGPHQNQLYEQARIHYQAKVDAGQIARYGSALGFMLVDGKGGEPDAKSGFTLLETSADLGSSHGAFLAGFILQSDDEWFVEVRRQAGIKQDTARGAKLIQRAARDGYPNAIQWCSENAVDFQK